MKSGRVRVRVEVSVSASSIGVGGIPLKIPFVLGVLPLSASYITHDPVTRSKTKPLAYNASDMESVIRVNDIHEAR